MSKQYARAQPPRRAAQAAALKAVPPDSAKAPKTAMEFADQPQQDRYEQLARARAATRRIADAELLSPLDPHWQKHLVKTASQILDALGDLALDSEFWNELSWSERALTEAAPEEMVTVFQILESDLIGLLDLMDYAPPPPSIEVAANLQLALAAVIEQPDRGLRGGLAKEARHRLLVYVYQLRPLLETAGDVKPNSAEGRRIGQRLRSAARAGARALIPATVAAGIVAVVFPPAGVASGVAAAAHGASQALQEFTKSGVEVASAGLLASALGDGFPTEGAMGELTASTISFRDASLEVLEVSDWLDDNQSEELPPMLRALTIEATRWYFQLERARAASDDSTRAAPARAAARAVAVALQDLNTWITDAADYDGLADINDRLKLALQQLDRNSTSD
jgi:hypothetical protein